MISINATLVVQVFNFLVLMWILNKILFKPILKTLEEREQSFKEARQKLDVLKTEAEQKTLVFEAQMKKARKAAAQTGHQIRKGATDQAKEIILQARTKANEHVLAIQAEAEKQADSVRQSLGDYKDAIVEMVYLKVMGRKSS